MDSDSSADEQDSFTTTSVLLGYASKDETEDPISHLGGLPQWLLEQPPSATLARCISCTSLMTLLLQLHADLPEHFPGHDRRLHIFACRRKTCQRKPGSVRVLRSTRVDPEVLAAEARANADAEAKARVDAMEEDEVRRREEAERARKGMLGNDLFGGGKGKGLGSGQAKVNPFAMGASAKLAAGANPFSLSSAGQMAAKAPQNPRPGEGGSSMGSDLSATFASKARISGAESTSNSNTTISATATGPQNPQEPIPHEPFPSDLSSLNPYPYLHLEADYEALGAAPPAPEQKVKVMDLDAEEGNASGPSSAKDEAATADMLMDETFQKFADRLWHNPEQVLRYEFGGRALLYSEKDSVGKSLTSAGKGGGGEGSGKVKVIGAGSSGIPRCAACGAGRVFEVQLTPGAIAELEAEEVAWEGMEWATVIVGVCEKDCLPVGTETGKVGYVEEWAGVQWEESKK